jgi:hypothetical protein
MPLSKPNLATELRAKIISKYGGNPDDSATLDKFCQAISEAVIDHIIANAVVTSVTATPNAQSGPTTLPGTATGTIS